jgi:hypothetical protein
MQQDLIIAVFLSRVWMYVAHTMAELKFGTVFVWATIWLVLALLCLLIGTVCAIPGPDEVADFTLCLKCQQAGCFACCNAPGMRLCTKMFGKDGGGGGGATTPGSNADDDDLVV